MTYAPRTLLDLRAFLVPNTGITDLRLLGITPDENHVGGYHCGWDRRRIVDGALRDYAWQESSRDWNHKTDAARAIDIGVFPRLRELSVWLVAQCAAGAADCADIREVIYSPDGRVVKRWDRLGRRTSGDSTHLTHTHVSYFADAEERPKTAVFKRFFGDDDMEQTDKLILKTSNPNQTIGDGLSDLFQERHWRVGVAASPVPGDESGEWPKPGSPAWNLAHLPQLLREHASAPVDPVALKAVLLDPEVLTAIARAVVAEIAS